MAASNYHWATWLADALRADPVLAPRVVEVDGWRTRGRPPADFSFLPSGVIDHHTACMCNVGHDPSSCVRSIMAGNSSAPGPIAQLLTSFTPAGVRWDGRNADPRVFVIAAGRCNHAGAGVYRWGAPEGNGSSIGHEVCGPPEGGWPDIVIEVRARVSAAILRRNGWPFDNVDTHNGYARPLGRKIDPSGAWRGQPNLGRLAPWNADLWRTTVAGYLAVKTQIPALEGVDPMADRILVDVQPGWFITDFATYAHPVEPIPDQTIADLVATLRVYKQHGIKLDESRGAAGIGDAFLLDRRLFLPKMERLAAISGY